MYEKNFAKINQKAVLGSQILAKAVAKLPNGRYEIMVVFAASSRVEFYWLFQTRSPRSPWRTWKFAGYSTRDLPQHYHDFGSYVSHRAQLHGAEVLSTRMPQKRRLASLMIKTAQESIFYDWSPRDLPGMPAAKFDRCRQKATNGRSGRSAFVWSR